MDSKGFLGFLGFLRVQYNLSGHLRTRGFRSCLFVHSLFIYFSVFRVFVYSFFCSFINLFVCSSVMSRAKVPQKLEILLGYVLYPPILFPNGRSTMAMAEEKMKVASGGLAEVKKMALISSSIAHHTQLFLIRHIATDLVKNNHGLFDT